MKSCQVWRTCLDEAVQWKWRQMRNSSWFERNERLLKERKMATFHFWCLSNNYLFHLFLQSVQGVTLLPALIFQHSNSLTSDSARRYWKNKFMRLFWGKKIWEDLQDSQICGVNLMFGELLVEHQQPNVVSGWWDWMQFKVKPVPEWKCHKKKL